MERSIPPAGSTTLRNESKLPDRDTLEEAMNAHWGGHNDLRARHSGPLLAGPGPKGPDIRSALGSFGLAGACWFAIGGSVAAGRTADGAVFARSARGGEPN